MYGGYFPTNDLILGCFNALFAWLAKDFIFLPISKLASIKELNNSVLFSKTVKNALKA